MLAKCANPACSTQFRYLRDGKLFEIEVAAPQDGSVGVKKHSRRIEFFWLCGPCSAELTLIRDPERGVRAVPLPEANQFLFRRAAAS